MSAVVALAVVAYLVALAAALVVALCKAARRGDDPDL